MKITVQRDWLTPLSTGSTVSINGKALFYGLEPPLDPAPGITPAIPEGVYPVWLRWSDKRGYWVPAVVGVPGHTDIEIHKGNIPSDTKGCLCVGKQRSADLVTQSEPAFWLLREAIMDRVPEEQVTIEYVNPKPAKEMNAQPSTSAPVAQAVQTQNQQRD